MSFVVVTTAVFAAAFTCWLAVGRGLGRRIDPTENRADEAASDR